MVIDIHDDEFHTILAALRLWQEMGYCDPDNRSQMLHDIATNMGHAISLDAAAIDALCEDLNCGERDVQLPNRIVRVPEGPKPMPGIKRRGKRTIEV